MKKKLLSVALAFTLLFSVSGCGSTSSDEASDQPQQETVETSKVETEPEAPTEAPEEPSEESQEPTETPAPTETDATEDGPVSTGSYEVDGISVTYYANVRNDTTGNWRLGVIYDSSDLNSYVVDYYNFFCRDDSEIHGIVNLGTETTVRISKVMSDTLEISVMEYVDGEEHDAKLLYSGDELERYWINMDTLEVDPIEDDE